MRRVPPLRSVTGVCTMPKRKRERRKWWIGASVREIARDSLRAQRPQTKRLLDQRDVATTANLLKNHFMK